ncbi:MAG: hypothetical protein IJS31_05895 [Oscillospiraceae bacterium]|nr:hypothetical protein [Oscillospiraceae bacterium]
MLLCVVMLFALAACGETGETANGGGMGSVNDLIAADSDYHGELPLVAEGEQKTLTIGIVNAGKVTDYNDNAYTAWLEEQTGIDLEFVQFAGTNKDAATQISLMMAAGEKLPDILWAFSGINKATGEQYGIMSTRSIFRSDRLGHQPRNEAAQELSERAGCRPARRSLHNRQLYGGRKRAAR